MRLAYSGVSLAASMTPPVAAIAAGAEASGAVVPGEGRKAMIIVNGGPVPAASLRCKW